MKKRIENHVFVIGLLAGVALSIAAAGCSTPPARTRDPLPKVRRVEIRKIEKPAEPPTPIATRPPYALTPEDWVLIYGGRAVKPPAEQLLPPLAISKAGWAPTGPREWKYIVIHHSATATGDADSFDRYHREKNRWANGLGYDFVIGNGTGSGDGEVQVGPRWRRQIDGAHAGNAHYNKHGIGVCLVGNFEKTGPSERQMRALVELVHFMQKRYGIPDSGIKMHRQVRDGETVCPGEHFDTARLFHLLRVRSRGD